MKLGLFGVFLAIVLLSSVVGVSAFDAPIIYSPLNITYHVTNVTNLTWSAIGTQFINYVLNDDASVDLYQEEGYPTGNFGAVGGDAWSSTTNGTYIWVLDGLDDKVYKHYPNGTYTGDFFETICTCPYGITNNGTNIFIAGRTTSMIYIYHMNGSIIGNFSTTGSGNTRPSGIVTDGVNIWTIDDNTLNVYKYWMNGTYTGQLFDISGCGDSMIGVTKNGSYIWVTSRSSKKVCRYFLNGTSTGFDWTPSQVGNVALSDIDNNGTNFFLPDYVGERVYIYDMNTVFYNTTFDSQEGSNVLIVNASDGVDWVSTTLYFTVDSIPPNITITSPVNDITYRLSGVIDLLVSASEDIDTWIYNINGDGNVTFTPDISFDLDDGSYNLLIYANDTSDLWAFTEINFTVDRYGVMSRNLVDAGDGLSGFLTGITDPMVTLIISLGMIGGILLIVHGFGSAIKSTLSGATAKLE